jgi:hypothetical protein
MAHFLGGMWGTRNETPDIVARVVVLGPQGMDDEKLSNKVSVIAQKMSNEDDDTDLRSRLRKITSELVSDPELLNPGYTLDTVSLTHGSRGQVLTLQTNAFGNIKGDIQETKIRRVRKVGGAEAQKRVEHADSTDEEIQTTDDSTRHEPASPGDTFVQKDEDRNPELARVRAELVGEVIAKTQGSLVSRIEAETLKRQNAREALRTALSDTSEENTLALKKHNSATQGVSRGLGDFLDKSLRQNALELTRRASAARDEKHGLDAFLGTNIVKHLTDLTAKSIQHQNSKIEAAQRAHAKRVQELNAQLTELANENQDLETLSKLAERLSRSNYKFLSRQHLKLHKQYTELVRTHIKNVDRIAELDEGKRHAERHFVEAILEAEELRMQNMQIDELQQAKEAAEARTVQLQDAQSAAEARVVELTQNLAGAQDQTQVESLSAQLGEARDRAEQSAQETVQMSETISELRSQLEERETQVAGELEQLRTSAEDAQEALQAIHNDEMMARSNDMNQLEVQLSQMQRQKEDRVDELTQVRREAEALVTQLQDAQSAAEARVVELTQNLAGAQDQTQVESLSAQLGEARDRAEQSAQETARMSETISELRSQLEERGKQVVELEQLQDEARAAHAELRTGHDAEIMERTIAMKQLSDELEQVKLQAEKDRERFESPADRRKFDAARMELRRAIKQADGKSSADEVNEEQNEALRLRELGKAFQPEGNPSSKADEPDLSVRELARVDDNTKIGLFEALGTSVRPYAWLGLHERMKGVALTEENFDVFSRRLNLAADFDVYMSLTGDRQIETVRGAYHEIIPRYYAYMSEINTYLIAYHNHKARANGEDNSILQFLDGSNVSMLPYVLADSKSRYISNPQTFVTMPINQLQGLLNQRVNQNDVEATLACLLMDKIVFNSMEEDYYPFLHAHITDNVTGTEDDLTSEEFASVLIRYTGSPDPMTTMQRVLAHHSGGVSSSEL